MRSNSFNVRYVSLFCLSVLLLVLTSCLPDLDQPVRKFSHWDKDVKELLAKMTLDEKIGQMIQAESCGLKDPADIENYYLGSIFSGGSADPKAGNSIEAWVEMVETLQRHTQSTRLKIPLLFGIDAVHGHNNVLNAVIFPHNIGLGCTRNSDLIEQIARITASEVRATGINWTFAPCITVPQDVRWGRTYEGYSENPKLVSVLGAAAVRGFQGSDLSDPLSVLACAKHYVGDGATAFGSAQSGRGLDQGDSRIDEETLRRIHLAPYKEAIEAGVATIMPSYSSWNGLKCSASKYLLTEVLKEEFGFEGFLISDYDAIHQLHPDLKTAIGICVNAGMDMAMESKDYRLFFDYLKELVAEGVVSMSRIDDAVTRILRVKFAMGMMAPDYDYTADRELQESFGSDEHRRVARRAVRESLVLLKNEQKTLPLLKSLGRIHVAGRSADNIGNQCGGWTIHWQGKSGRVTSGGTTILEAIKKSVSSDTHVTFTQDGTAAAGADVGIVIIGETPYAEGSGDTVDLSLARQDIAAVQNMKKAQIPVIVILISGRPMIISDVLNQADGFIAAWLPGTEGRGVTDILFGDFNPTGKLSFTWPKSMSQIPVNQAGIEYKPLFGYGYGLSY